MEPNKIPNNNIIFDNSGTSKPDDPLTVKYRGAAAKCEELAQNFAGLPVYEVIEKYNQCLLNVEELVTFETKSEYLTPLENVQTQMIWQLQCLSDISSVEVFNNGETGTDNDVKNSKRPKLSNEESRVSNRQNVIESTLRVIEGNGLNDVAGLDNVKTILRKSVILPMSFPSLFTGGRKPWSQILLFGPPGTGKSKIASALACEAKAKFYCISSADLLSSWVGESEKMIKELFEFTRNKAEKCIVFIDEIDSICRKRNNREGDHTRSMKNQLLVELDQNLTSVNNCFVLCATNCPWDIDSAFMRRFQRRIYIPLPDRQSRLTIMKKKCEGVNFEMSDLDWESVLDKTEGYTGSDLINVTTYALQEPLGEVENNQNWIFTSDGKWMPCPCNTFGCFTAPLSAVPPDKICVRNVSLNDFLKAIQLTPKTVVKSELERYDAFLTQYG